MAPAFIGQLKCRFPAAIAPPVSDLELIAIKLHPDTCGPSMVMGSSMSGKRVVWIVLVSSLWSGIGLILSANAARAVECHTAPDAAAASGQHWYYRTDRATQKKCWHLDVVDGASDPAAETSQTTATVSSTPAAKKGLPEKDVETLYTQFLEWEHRPGQ